MPPRSHVKIELHGQGSVSDYSPAQLKRSVAEAFAAAAAVPISAVHVDISAASILITVTIDTSDQQSTDAVIRSVSPFIGDQAAATDFLAVAQVVVDQTPTVTSQLFQIGAGAEAASPSGSPLLLLIALGVGAVLGASFCARQLRRMRQERYKNFVDERLGGTGTLEVVASPLHSVQLFGISERPLPEPTAQVQLSEAEARPGGP